MSIWRWLFPPIPTGAPDPFAGMDDRRRELEKHFKDEFERLSYEIEERLKRNREE